MAGNDGFIVVGNYVKYPGASPHRTGRAFDGKIRNLNNVIEIKIDYISKSDALYHSNFNDLLVEYNKWRFIQGKAASESLFLDWTQDPVTIDNLQSSGSALVGYQDWSFHWVLNPKDEGGPAPVTQDNTNNPLQFPYLHAVCIRLFGLIKIDSNNHWNEDQYTNATKEYKSPQYANPQKPW